MIPEELLTLQLRYAQAVYLAEHHRHASEVLHQRLLQAARQQDQAALAPAIEPTQTLVQPYSPDRLRALVTQSSAITGLFTLTAAALGLSVSHVRQVALGKRKSDRAMAELLQQWKSLDLQGGAE